MRIWPVALAVIATALPVAGQAGKANWTAQMIAEWENAPANVRSWFKSVRSPQGIPCCDVADGHRTDYEARSDGYWVPIDGEMYHVPPEAVVNNANNPTGDAIVWFVQQYAPAGMTAPKYFIRCFVAGNQG